VQGWKSHVPFPVTCDQANLPYALRVADRA
jgi:hypothetical protein